MKIDTNARLIDAAKKYVSLSRCPLSQLYKGRLLDEELILAESGLVISLKHTPNKYGEGFISKPFTVEFVFENGNLDIHIWNDVGIVTSRPISFAGIVTLGNSREMLERFEHDDRGLTCELFCESSNATRTIKVFPLDPQIKRLIIFFLRVEEQSISIPAINFQRYQQKVNNVQVALP